MAVEEIKKEVKEVVKAAEENCGNDDEILFHFNTLFVVYVPSYLVNAHIALGGWLWEILILYILLC